MPELFTLKNWVILLAKENTEKFSFSHFNNIVKRRWKGRGFSGNRLVSINMAVIPFACLSPTHPITFSEFLAPL